MKAPKKPKYTAQPKTPKMNASDAAWDAYREKVKKVDAENMKKKSEYEKALREYQNEIKRREAIKAQAAKNKSKL